MNALDRIPPTYSSRLREPTQAAEGLPRWRWTTAELLAAVRAGIIHEHERFELIGGEMVPMSPKGNRHEVVRTELAFFLSGLAKEAGMLRVSSEPQFNLTDDTYTDPDILVHPASIKSPFVRGETVLLVIEVAVTSLAYDLATKAALYASFGVREYWVIEANSLRTKVHLDPEPGGYRSIVPYSRRKRLIPQLVPQLAVRLGDLDLG